MPKFHRCECGGNVDDRCEEPATEFFVIAHPKFAQRALMGLCEDHWSVVVESFGVMGFDVWLVDEEPMRAPGFLAEVRSLADADPR